MVITIYIIIIIFLFAALHLHYSTKGRTARDMVFGVVLWVVIIHNLTFFPVWFISLDDYSYIYYAAPFSLFYGPLLYFYFQASIYEKLSRRLFFLHGLPIMAGWIAYFIFIFGLKIRGQIQIFYYPVLYSCIGISLVTYPICIFLKQRQTNITKIIYFSWYCVLCGLFILFMALQMVIHPYRDNQLIFKSNGITVALFMFLGALMLFTEAFQRFNSGFISEYKPHSPKVLGDMRKNSSKPQPVNAAFHTKVTKESQMLDVYFSSDAIQNMELNLKIASSQLKITQKKLSELILVSYGTTFIKLLTRKRIEYACRILLSPEFDDLYEKLPHLCGFKSASSFYRHFRALQHCSPSEFRYQYFESANQKYSVNIK